MAMEFVWSRSAKIAWVWFGTWVVPAAVLEATALTTLGLGMFLAVGCLFIGSIPIGLIVHSEAK